MVFVLAAFIFGVISHSFLRGGASVADQKLGLVVGPLLKGPADPPVFAYYISGTGGEGQKMLRLLKAVYHPRNQYVLHLDAGSSALERINLARSIQSERLFGAFRNVDVIGQSYAMLLRYSQNTTVNNDLRYIVWDNPPGLEPLFLNQSYYKAMIKSRSAFARKFMEDDPVLKKVDKRILKRAQNGVGFGQWCSAQLKNKRENTLEGDTCSSGVDINTVKPGPSAARLKSLVLELISEESLFSNQCEV
ncbi:hypothetical protein B296_00054000 [Ensete ventricosum]|uniref:Uncharacterized protein n=1 Tax=Ensete ventricosum TaxID=4639 RepID=A0A426Y0Y1_ENSVE|nr:hypothetical protein B296_00054000 [Ensete ventricosum]